MRIQELYIDNFKSLVDFKLVNPNPFSVFVGPNGAGKSNIFESLEYVSLAAKMPIESVNSLFEGASDFLNINSQSNNEKQVALKHKILFQGINAPFSVDRIFGKNETSWQGGVDQIFSNKYTDDDSKVRIQIGYLEQFFHKFSRLFVKVGKKRLNIDDDSTLSANADNLEKVLKRVLRDQTKKEELLDWLRLFVPEFENIEVHSDNIGGTDTLLVYEKNIKKPLRRNLISDGTYNILALLTAVYQSDEPQFLCIEEPENGLNPYVVRELVNFFRSACEQMGHTIWLNTHSQSLVGALRPEEIIVVNKKDGVTKAKQFDKSENLHGLTMDEAWLSNALGGGLPW